MFHISGFRSLGSRLVSVLCFPLFVLLSLGAYADDLLGVACQTPPPAHCQDGDCASKLTIAGNAVETESGREFFFDYPCDLQDGEDVVFILNIHGAGSFSAWQRHYFPAMDFKDDYRLVVATGTAAGSASMGSGPGVRMWIPENDDAYLQNITEQVIDAVGAENIRAFWLAGHSQGGITSRRLVCTPFFRDKVDGMLSLSGGRIGNAPIVDRFGPPMPDGSPPPARNRPLGDAPLPDCDFSHIYTTGELEIKELPETSPWAAKYNCLDREHYQVVDTEPGWVTDSNRSGYPVWGREARPGTADVFEFTDCVDGRVVADVIRLDKGHTEGLEPAVTERIVQLMVSAKGGKIAGN